MSLSRFSICVCVNFMFSGVYLSVCVIVYTWLACDILLDLLWRLAGSPSLILSMLQPHDSMVFRDSLTGQQYASLSCKVTTKLQTKTDSESVPQNYCTNKTAIICTTPVNIKLSAKCAREYFLPPEGFLSLQKIILQVIFTTTCHSIVSPGSSGMYMRQTKWRCTHRKTLLIGKHKLINSTTMVVWGQLFGP